MIIISILEADIYSWNLITTMKTGHASDMGYHMVKLFRRDLEGIKTRQVFFKFTGARAGSG